MEGRKGRQRAATRIAIRACGRQSLEAPWDRAEICLHGGYRAMKFTSVRPARDFRQFDVGAEEAGLGVVGKCGRKWSTHRAREISKCD